MGCDLGENITFKGEDGRFGLNKNLSHESVSIKVEAKPVTHLSLTLDKGAKTILHVDCDHAAS